MSDTWQAAVNDVLLHRQRYEAEEENARILAGLWRQNVADALINTQPPEPDAVKALAGQVVRDILGGEITAPELEAIRDAGRQASLQGRDEQSKGAGAALEGMAAEALSFFFAADYAAKCVNQTEILEALAWDGLKLYARANRHVEDLLRVLAENKNSILSIDTIAKESGLVVGRDEMDGLARDFNAIYADTRVASPALSVTTLAGEYFYGLREKEAVKGVEKLLNLKTLLAGIG